MSEINGWCMHQPPDLISLGDFSLNRHLFARCYDSIKVHTFPANLTQGRPTPFGLTREVHSQQLLMQ